MKKNGHFVKTPKLMGEDKDKPTRKLPRATMPAAYWSRANVRKRVQAKIRVGMATSTASGKDSS